MRFYRLDRALDLARFTVQTFLLHASIVQPLGESGKLKLTQDTTSLEFSINHYLSGYDISLQDMGDQFKALRGEYRNLSLSRARPRML